MLHSLRNAWDILDTIFSTKRTEKSAVQIYRSTIYRNGHAEEPPLFRLPGVLETAEKSFGFASRLPYLLHATPEAPSFSNVPRMLRWSVLAMVYLMV